MITKAKFIKQILLMPQNPIQKLAYQTSNSIWDENNINNYLLKTESSFTSYWHISALSLSNIYIHLTFLHRIYVRDWCKSVSNWCVSHDRNFFMLTYFSERISTRKSHFPLAWVSFQFWILLMLLYVHNPESVVCFSPHK